MEAEFQIFGSPGKDEMRKWTYPYLKVLAEQVWKMNEIFRVLAEKKSGTSDLWLSMQRRSAEAQLHIFESSGRDEMRKWTYPYLEVLVEQVRKKNDIFRSPGRAEVKKTELLFFGSKDRAELRKQSFRPLKVLAEQS